MFWNVSLPCQTELVISKCLLCASTGYPESFGNYSLVPPLGPLPCTMLVSNGLLTARPEDAA